MWTLTPHFVHALPLVTVDPPSWSELGAYFVAVVALAGSWVTAKIGRKTGEEANAIEFSKSLMQEVKDLKTREKDREDRIDKLEEKQDETDRRLTDTLEILSVAVSFIDELYRWGRMGGGEPEPTIPERLREWLSHLVHRKEHS